MKESLSVAVVVASLLLVAAGGALSGHLSVNDSTRDILGAVCAIVGVTILVVATSGYNLTKQGNHKPRSQKTK